MQVSQLEWIIALSATIAVLLFDVVVIGRRPHEPSKRETGTALAIYIGLAMAFGIWVLIFRGIFIALGAVAINQFSFVFYVFGAFLLYTAINLARNTDHDDADNIVV